MIVDDDTDSSANLQDILAEHGYETESAQDAPSALKKLPSANSSEPFGLVLLDFKMPGMDGATLYERIRVHHPDIPAIMITAYAGDDGVQRAIAAGTLQVLRKPVDVPRLLELIDEALNPVAG